MNKYIVEFIGTFFLVLTIGLTVLAGKTGIIAPLAIGAALMVMIFAGGHVSGAHFNPAVTLAVWMRGRCDSKDVVPYWVSQIVGAAVAAVAVKFLRSDAMPTAISPAIAPALLSELLFTFALAWVILNVATAKGTSGNSFYGLAIGMTVMVGAFSVGDISGAVFNPAVAIGVSILGLSSWNHIWIYLAANMAGGALAAVMFKVCNPADV